MSQKGDKIVGFVAFAADIGSLYKSAILENGMRFVLLLAGRLFSIKNIRNILETMFYPARTKKKIELPKAELLSIVVAEEERGKGLSEALIREGLALCRQKKIENVKVLIGTDNEPANRLYRRCGFRLVCQIYNHGISSNLYVGSTNHLESR